MSRKTKQKYITRINHGSSSTKGWQVRLPTKNKEKRYLSSFFSDGVFKGKDKALAAAIEWRDKEAAKLGVCLSCKRAVNKSSSTNTSGFIGVSRIVKTRDNETVCEGWEAYYSVKGVDVKRCFSLAKYGEAEAFREACKVRYDHAGPLRQVSKKTQAPCEPPVPVIKAYEND